jgi:putative sigma-54 modulation protein
MQITVTGRHVKVSDGLRDHIYSKVEQDLADFPRILSAHVILTVEKYRHIAEVVLQAPPHLRVESSHESQDMYVSIDGALDKARKQLRHHVDKAYQHKSHEKLSRLEVEGARKAETKEKE